MKIKKINGLDFKFKYQNLEYKLKNELDLTAHKIDGIRILLI
jgi:hypothetical protein